MSDTNCLQKDSVVADDHPLQRSRSVKLEHWLGGQAHAASKALYRKNSFQLCLPMDMTS